MHDEVRLQFGTVARAALAAPTGRLGDTTPAISSLEHAIVHRFGDRDVLVATKDGWIVVVAPAETDLPGPPKRLGDLMLAELSRSTRGQPWQVTVGRAYPGPYGIARSYAETKD